MQLIKIDISLECSEEGCYSLAAKKNTNERHFYCSSRKLLLLPTDATSRLHFVRYQMQELRQQQDR